MPIDIYVKQHILHMAGGQVCVYESGEEDAPPVLLLHGSMYDEARLIWHNLAPELSKTRRVFALDFPRHGQSRPWTGKVDQECLNQVVNRALQEFDLAPLPLIGLSMGGGVAISYALKYPDQVSGAVLMGPGGLGYKVPNQFISWLFIKIPGALRAITRYYGKLSTEKLQKTMASSLHDGEITIDFGDLVAILTEEAGRKWEFREDALDDWQKEVLAPFKLKVNFLPKIDELSCPTLWLRGENDPLIRQKDIEEAARLSKGKLHIVKNAGHLIPLEQPEEVSLGVKGFLERNHL